MAEQPARSAGQAKSKSKRRGRGPDFLGIGAARSGTTWLASNLSLSSEIFLPKRKELHYFTRSLRYPSSSFLLDRSLVTRLFGREERHGRFRYELGKAMAGNVLHPSLAQLRWDARFFLGRYDDDWYLSLFRSDKISGEITPAYALLDDDDVAALAGLLPQVKILYLIRNPVLRAWSTMRYHETRGAAGLTKREEEDIKAYLSREGIVARSQYADVIRRWRRFFPEDQFLVAYYDELTKAPQDLMRRVLSFLGVHDADEVLGRLVTEGVNASGKQHLPPSIEAFLSRQYLPMLEDLAELVGSSYVKSWLVRARESAS